ncbi:MAG: ribonuclease domain-containing protein [Oscillospiraceae bacterium]
MNKKLRTVLQIIAILILIVLAFFQFRDRIFTDEPPAAGGQENSSLHQEQADKETVFEDEEYTSKEELAAYIHEFGHLPTNFITKNEAEAMGWEDKQGNLADVAPQKSIGGGRFGNYEGLLPNKKGREWRECDVGYKEGYRNAKRIVYSNDGLIYYTEDHYKTFLLLYGEEQ